MYAAASLSMTMCEHMGLYAYVRVFLFLPPPPPLPFSLSPVLRCAALLHSEREIVNVTDKCSFFIYLLLPVHFLLKRTPSRGNQQSLTWQKGRERRFDSS
ncbi:hypothetical protein TRVL_02181 [Trypanosoma vivax]|nr:hypothetical protein TRVL_02181 [Trypanosoma vivax]